MGLQTPAEARNCAVYVEAHALSSLVTEWAPYSSTEVELRDDVVVDVDIGSTDVVPAESRALRR